MPFQSAPAFQVTRRLRPGGTLPKSPVKATTGTGTLGSVAQMSVRGTHSCATLTDGTARCWGNNVNGRLGDGTSTNRLLPVIVKDPTGSANLSGVVQVSAGMHSCAVMTDGSARCWGGNANGQLGDGTTTGRVLPVQVLLP